jgi:N5-(cytidine 5'-diphosphoramidyl)-L-glutamine hydrolase
MRIGLTMRPESIGPPYNEQRDCIDQRWTKLLIELGHVPIFIPTHIQLAPIKSLTEELELEGLILTGGGVDSTRDLLEYELIVGAVTRKLPLLGVCRGFQILNQYYGGGVSSTVVGHRATRHSVVWEGQRIETNSYHDHVIWTEELADLLIPTGVCGMDVSVEAARHVHLPQYGVMWHPEREPELTPYSETILRRLFG